MGRALLVLVVALGTALVVFWLAAPRLLSAKDSENAAASAQETSHSESALPPIGSASAASEASISSSEPGIAPPLTPEEREYADVEAKRAPFYADLRRNYPYITAVRPLRQDQATLEIYIGQDDARLIATLVYDAVWPHAKRYGFRRIRFYLPNPPGSVDRYRLDSESTVDGSGVWNTFRK